MSQRDGSIQRMNGRESRTLLLTIATVVLTVAARAGELGEPSAGHELAFASRAILAELESAAGKLDAKVQAAFVAAGASVVAAGFSFIGTYLVSKKAKKLEAAYPAGREILVSPLTIDRDALMSCRAAIYSAERAADRWIQALSLGEDDRGFFDIAQKATAAISERAASIPLGCRGQVVESAERLNSSLVMIFQDAYEDGTPYARDGEQCGGASKRIGAATASAHAALDERETELDAERKNLSQKVASQL